MSAFKNMSCVIIDDDPAYIEIISSMIEKYKGLELLGQFNDSTEGFQSITLLNPDIVFLDIEMPNMNGLELLASLKKNIPVILISSREDYALQAFNFDVIDYIVKPIEYPRFVQAVTKAQRFVSSQAPGQEHQSGQLFIKVGNSFKNVHAKNILYVQAYGDFVKIHTVDGMLTVHSTLKQVEDTLSADEFVKVHRSYIVRIDQINDFNQSNLVVKDKVIPISHRNRKQLLDKLNTL